VDEYPPLFFAKNVEDALDELAALIPPRPAGVGFWNTTITPYYNSLPDWGSLKEADAPLTVRDPGSFPTWLTTTPDEIYPYYWIQPSPANVTPPFNPLGSDPDSDLTFNVADGVYTGGGSGQCFIGAFTRGNPGPVVQTVRITTRDLIPTAWPVVVSGTVSPADRGVLALLYWPFGATVPADFTNQNLEDRVIAAILLGQGIDHKEGSTDCDGGPGGIFSMGETSGEYDPFAFPGQASGQYDLSELTALDPAAGQVRLGIDPNAEPTGITIPGGFPVLGASAISAGGGDDNNFFRYRLPYLKNYSALKWTPAVEQTRYFAKPPVSLNPGTDLAQAGDFSNFDADYRTFQVARYRHRFELPNTAIAGDMEDAGTVILVHFKKEADFESYVAYGTMPGPLTYSVYSASQVSGTVPPELDNVEDSVTNLAAVPYHVLRSDIVNDPDGATEPATILTTATYDGVDKMWVSGIEYFTPTDTLGNLTFTISDAYLEMQNFYNRTYLLSPLTTVLHTAYPVTFGVAPFAYEVGNVNVSGGILSTVQERQRIEVTFETMGGSMLAGPQPADWAYVDWTGETVTFNGDLNSPSFSSNALARFFIRRPLGQALVGTAVMPAATNGSVAVNQDAGNPIVLYHSTVQPAPVYGNFVFPPGGPALPTLETSLKDTEERFLDEVYRYCSDWSGSGGVDPTITAELLGPGISNFSAIPVPVRAGTAVDADFSLVSYLQQGFYALTLVGTPELQVAGLPDRNPYLTEGVISPFPSAGVLLYPKTDYSGGGVDYNPVGLDYSGCSGDREYVRAFDAAFSQSGTPVAAAGQPFVTFRIDGIKREDFAYVAPGPGSYHLSGVAIFVKVPGLTTWMDIGRADGSGPSKQDPFLDGAGCAVIGTGTRDGVDSFTGQVYTQVKINVGPVANLAVGEGDEVPVLVKVLMRDPSTMADPTLTPLYYDFDHESVGGPGFVNPPSTGPLLSPGVIRGIIGIKLERP